MLVYKSRISMIFIEALARINKRRLVISTSGRNLCFHLSERFLTLFGMTQKESFARVPILFLYVSIFFAASSLFPGFIYADSIVIQQYKKALELDPGNINARYQLAIALLRDKEFDEAAEHLLVIKRERPKDPQISYYMGIARAGRGELEEAIAEYDLVLSAVGTQKAHREYELATVYYNIGISYQRDEKSIEALNAYKKSSMIDPEQRLAYCRMGEVYYSSRDYAASLDNLLVCESRSADKDKEEVRRQIVAARTAKGIDLVNKNKYPDALLEFRKAYELDSESERTQYFLGYGYYLNGDFKKSLAVLGKLSTPKSAEVYNNLPPLLQNIALELNEREDWENSEKAALQAIEMKKNDADFRYLLGFIRLKKNDYEGAMLHIKNALVLDPAHSKATLTLAIVIEKTIEERVNRARLLFSEENFSEALNVFNSVLELDPNNSVANAGSRDTYNKIEAIKEIEQTKRRADISERLAAAGNLMKSEDFKEALSAYRFVLTLDQKNEEALQGSRSAEQLIKERKERHLSLGNTYAAAGRHFLALTEYRTALRYDPDDNFIMSREVESAGQLRNAVKPLIDKAIDNEEQGRLGDAVMAFTSAIELDPDNKEAIAGQKRTSKNLEVRFSEKKAAAKRLLKEKNYMEALSNIKAALFLKPDEEDLKNDLAKIRMNLTKLVEEKLKEADSLIKAGNYAGVLPVYEEILTVDETNLKAQEGLTNARKNLNMEISQQLAEAQTAYDKGSWYKAWQLYGLIISIDKDNNTAREMRLKSRDKLDDLTAPLIKHAMEAYNNGKMDDAAIEFKKTINIDPSNETAKKYLAGIDNVKLKKNVAEKVEKLYMKGIQYYTEGKYTEAIKVWDEVLDLSPGHEKAVMNIKRTKKKLEGVMDAK